MRHDVRVGVEVRNRRWLLAGLVVAGLGMLLLVSAGRWGATSARVLGEDRGVNARAGDPGDISAHNSPTLVRNPRDPDNVAATSRIDTPRFGCALHVSHDGGRRWRPTRLPMPPSEQPKCYAPDAAFGADGRLFVSYVTLRGMGNVPNAVWITSSSDGGRTLSPPRRVSGPLAFQVRLAADPGAAGRLHLTWLQADEVGPLRFTGPGNRIVAARSEDGGATWTEPSPLSSPTRGRVLAPTPQVGRDGDLYVVFLDVGDDRLDYEGGHDALGGPPYGGRFELVLGRSRDGGRSWEESVVDDAVVPTRRFVPFLPPFPALAVDRGDGTIHVAFHDGRRGSSDVWLWTLEPGAGGWSPPTRVNDTDEEDRSSQHLPQIALSPGGRLDVVYYDRRSDPGGTGTEVSLQSSTDGGRSFGDRVVLSSRAFDGGIGAGSERGLPDHGSRLGLVSGDRWALAAWSDTRAGTEASNKQDIRVAELEFTGARAAWRGTAGRVAGAVLLLLGAAAALVSLRRPSRADP